MLPGSRISAWFPLLVLASGNPKVIDLLKDVESTWSPLKDRPMIGPNRACRDENVVCTAGPHSKLSSVTILYVGFYQKLFGHTGVSVLATL